MRIQNEKNDSSDTCIQSGHHLLKTNLRHGRQTFWRLLPLLAIWGSILSCNLFGDGRAMGSIETQTSTVQVGQPDQEDLSISATQTYQAVFPSPTTLPTLSSPAPTWTSIPTAVNMPVAPIPTSQVLAREIYFRRGGTSAHFQKPIVFGEPHTYPLRALEGQTLILTATSPDNDVFLDVKGIEDGTSLVSAADGISYWFGKLPKTQTYQITLATNNPETYYFFSVEVPANIAFEPGAYSATIDGFVDVDANLYPDVMTRVRYLIYASMGQTMTVELISPNLDDLSLGILGQQDGQPYLRYEVKTAGGELNLPVTQGYYLDVWATGGVSTQFTLKVTIK